MKQDTNKEDLRKLLNFLKNNIIHKPENSWFVNELQKLLPSTKNDTISSLKNSSLAKIEEYLGLDYRIDSKFSLCDYSFLDDSKLRENAECDFREMMRFKYGLRSHKVDFAEFCRYIILQTELILNYFYTKYYSDKGGIISAVDNIKEYNKNGERYLYNNKSEDVTCVEDIPFNYKLWGFKKQYNVKINNIDNARKLRNTISHRSASSCEKDITKLHQKVVDMGIAVKEDGTLPYIEKSKLSNKDVKDYLFELFLQQQPFENLEKELKSLVDKVRSLIETT